MHRFRANSLAHSDLNVRPLSTCTPEVPPYPHVSIYRYVLGYGTLKFIIIHYTAL
jgi:hypothetical protein